MQCALAASSTRSVSVRAPRHQASRPILARPVPSQRLVLAAAEPDKFNGEGSQFDMKDVTGDAKQAGDAKQQSAGQEEPEQFNGEGSGFNMKDVKDSKDATPASNADAAKDEAVRRNMQAASPRLAPGRGRFCAARPLASSIRTPARRSQVRVVAAGAPHRDGSGDDSGGSTDAVSSGSSDVEVEVLQEKLRMAERKLEEQQERAAFLQPFRVAAPKCGVIGESRYAKALRKAIVQASRDKTRRPVLVFGEPGLEKDNLGALIHFGSPDHEAPFVRLDCDRLDSDASDLLGAGKKKGLLHYLPPEGTLLLNNIQKAPPAAVPLLQDLISKASKASEEGNSSTYPRIILVSESALPKLAPLCTVIKVAPLRVRPQDVRALQAFFLRNIGRQRGLPNLRLTDEAVRQLQACSFPYNIAELQTMVERAAAQASGSGNLLTEDVFWAAKEPKDMLRFNLLKIPPLRRFLRSSLWPEDINHKFTAWAFVALVLLLFFGPQDRSHNFGLNLFWCWWWPASFFVYPFLGRVWCSVCPFMIWGEITQRWRLSRGAKLMKWPREQMDKYGAWFLLGLFSVILVWEEVWDLPDNAALSSWLLLLITAGAMIGSWHFERRIWCRYLCPIGGMNGLFAKLSMTELRARQGVCSSSCTTYHCFKGGPAEAPEGLETNGCPVYSHPAQLVDNRNCVLCMECLKACPHKSIEFRLRLPGVELWTSHKPMLAEVYLMFMLLGAVYLHDCDDVLLQLGQNPAHFLVPQLNHILTSFAFLATPGLMALGVDTWWRFTLPQPASQLVPAFGGSSAGGSATGSAGSSAGGTSGSGGSGGGKGFVSSAAARLNAISSLQKPPAPLRPFVELAYGYLPMVYTATLAFYLDNAFEEAGLVLQVFAEMVGLEGAIGPYLPELVVDPLVTEFLQGSTLLFGAALSLILTRKLGARPWAQLVPQCALILAFTVELYTLIIPN
ncbi:hypothetical protein D9Q98_009634 [Chlorella vulgaris]|uniref:Uncharacterized protein n=1 Tax=Chlorella vulgaris TaxID=3077 RepID=A0A9D4TES0_CHLVU|nr:hypothetical protein D9Q98_009634 [Chlorella vulgaris]